MESETAPFAFQAPPAALLGLLWRLFDGLVKRLCLRPEREMYSATNIIFVAHSQFHAVEALPPWFFSSQLQQKQGGIFFRTGKGRVRSPGASRPQAATHVPQLVLAQRQGKMGGRMMISGGLFQATFQEQEGNFHPGFFASALSSVVVSEKKVTATDT